jgi:hypothetical protein
MRTRWSRAKTLLGCFFLLHLYGIWWLVTSVRYLPSELFPTKTIAPADKARRQYPFLSDFVMHKKASAVLQGDTHCPGQPTSPTLRKRQLCFLTLEFAGLGKAGGIGTAVWSLASLFSAEGFNITVLHSPWGSLTKDEKLEARKQILQLKQAHIHLVTLKREPGTGQSCNEMCATSAKMLAWLQQNPGRCDAIYYHDNMAIAYWPILARHQGFLLSHLCSPLTCIYWVGLLSATSMILGLHGPHIWERTANDVVVTSQWNLEIIAMEDMVLELSDWVIRYCEAGSAPKMHY